MDKFLHDHNVPLTTGWECPKCHAVMAPFTLTCWYCKPKVLPTDNDSRIDWLKAPTTITNVGEIKPTCGTNEAWGMTRGEFLKQGVKKDV